MEWLVLHERLLFYIQIAALVLLLGRIVTAGLQHVYRYFFLYLIAALAQTLIGVFIDRHTNLYAILYLATEGVIVCFYALIVLELYGLVLKGLEGLASVSRRYIWWAIAASSVISLVVLMVQHMSFEPLPLFYTFESTIVSSLMFFILLITAFLVYYPVPMNRNVIYYSIGYAVYFLCKAASLLMLNSHSEWFHGFSLVILGISTACLLFWAVRLTAAGEKKAVVVGHRWDKQHEEKLLRQLEAINASLLRSRK